jgi:predicted NAD-dependent protein-ADP-ribosyltransferase YbiA (DUF1768 family)
MGLTAKFYQNNYLADKLLETDHCIIAYESNDALLGTGRGVNNLAQDWFGLLDIDGGDKGERGRALNLVGNSFMKIRNELRLLRLVRNNNQSSKPPGGC